MFDVVSFGFDLEFFLLLGGNSILHAAHDALDAFVAVPDLLLTLFDRVFFRLDFGSD